MDMNSKPQSKCHWMLIWQRIAHYTSLLISLIIYLCYHSFPWITRKDSEPKPYHTLTLTGEEWVIELLMGHPEWIQCELGVHAHVFTKLILELQALGHSNSKFVSLEKQLTIFLYSSITGLTIWHIRKWFQWSNETISQWVSFLCTSPLLLSPSFHQIFPQNALYLLILPILLKVSGDWQDPHKNPHKLLVLAFFQGHCGCHWW